MDRLAVQGTADLNEWQDRFHHTVVETELQQPLLADGEGRVLRAAAFVEHSAQLLHAKVSHEPSFESGQA